MNWIFPVIGFSGVAIAVAVLWSMLLSIPVWLLWNGCLVWAVSAVNSVTWPQAWGITVLAWILMGRVGGSNTKK
jgi:hypothetical protein